MGNIYSLRLKNEIRNIYSESIDNIYWDFINFEMTHEIPATRIIEYFFDTVPYKKLDGRKNSYQLADEYGLNPLSIGLIFIDKTWNQIMKEAKQLAPKEIESIRQHSTDDRYDSDIAFLENIALI